jgi:hypothetical protein
MGAPGAPAKNAPSGAPQRKDRKTLKGLRAERNSSPPKAFEDP